MNSFLAFEKQNQTKFLSKTNSRLTVTLKHQKSFLSKTKYFMLLQEKSIKATPKSKIDIETNTKKLDD